MRFQIFFYMIIFLIISAKAQDLEPSQQKFYFHDEQTPKYLSGDSLYFKQTDFFLSWEWGSGGKISSSLFINNADICSIYDKYRNVDSNQSMVAKREIYTHFPGWGIINTRAIQYEPTLLIDSLNPEAVKTRSNDTTNPVFGFMVRKGRVIDNPSDPNFNRLMIDNVPSGTVILDKSWPQDQFFFTNEAPEDSINRPKILDSIQCQTLYISLNLRRFDDLTNNDTILKIELPYSKSDTTSQGIDTILHSIIKLQMIPSQFDLDTFSLMNGRGIIRKMINCLPYTRSFYITRSMIPPDSFNKDITISAYFKCDGTEREFTNLRINQGKYCIKTLGIRITYLDSTCPLGIDWVRFETPHARVFLQGKFDSIMINNTQKDIDTLTNSNGIYNQQGNRLFRYKLATDYGAVQNWIGFRYFNKMIGNISTSVDGISFPVHYYHYIKPIDRWFGFCKNIYNVSAPYCKKVLFDAEWGNLWKCLYLLNGYTGIDSLQNGNPFPTEQNYCSYETYLYDAHWHNQSWTQFRRLLPIAYFLQYPDSIEVYERVLNPWNNYKRASYQSFWENILYNYFYKDEVKNFLYENHNWYAESYIHIMLKDDTVRIGTQQILDTISYFDTRPFTGEEIRLATFTPIILGAKGLAYDGFGSYYDKIQIYDDLNISATLKDSIENLPDLQFLESDIGGSDFIRESNEIWDLNNRILLDTVSIWLERPRDRIYIGRKSVRLEIRKIHSWIRAIENTLINLRLQSYWAKGYRKWYSQHPTLEYNLTSKFIDTNGIRTKHPLSSSYEGTTQYNYIDSSFYDITILRDIKNDSNMTNAIYLGVVNRRTNPLILENDTLNFYSTAEFDKFVQEGGKRLNGDSMPPSYWQNLWWKRLGCRELTIPFNYKYSADTNQYALLRITELGYNDTNLTKLAWRNSKYYHTIDTVIRQDRSLVVRLLPGEGKILKVEVLPPGQAVSGNLAHSNQSKIVCHPVLDTAGNMTDTVRYHLVYFHKKNGDSTKNAVYYRRSCKVWKNLPMSQVNWESEISLSDTIVQHIWNGDNWQYDTFPNRSCDYPSIVVRKDSSDTLKAYVVFSCSWLIDTINVSVICEAIFPVEPINLPNTVNSTILSTYNGENRAEWGTPVINASYGYNYYAWSDSLKYIVAACKSPNTILFDSISKIEYIRWDNFTREMNVYGTETFEFERKNSDKHPSMNVYSSINSGENNCALVWQSYVLMRRIFTPHNDPPEIDTMSAYQIFYTRLRNRNDTIQLFLPDSFSYSSLSTRLNINKTIAAISNFEYPFDNNTFPVVIRSLNPSDTAMLIDTIGNRRDRIYWQTDKIEVLSGTFASKIKTRALDMFDSSGFSKKWKIFKQGCIYSYNDTLVSANISNGYSTSSAINIDGLLLGFNVFNPDDKNIWQYPHSFSSLLYYIPTDIPVSSVPDFCATGTLPHLSKNINYFTKNDGMWKTRIVFQDEDDSIASTSKNYYRKFNRFANVEGLFGFKGNNLKFLMSFPLVNGKKLRVRLPFMEIQDSINGNYFIRIPCDTIFTEWFRVTNSAILNFKILGVDTSFFVYKIQKLSNGNFYNVNIEPTRNNIIGKLKDYLLINGNDDLYRLLLIKKIPLFDYTEEVFLNGLLIDGRSQRDVYNEVIDLNNNKCVEIVNNNKITIYLYPNPANNIIYVTTYLPISTLKEMKNENIVLKLYNTLGEEINRYKVQTSETINISTEKLHSGMYFISAEEEIKFWDSEVMIPAITNFIVR